MAVYKRGGVWWYKFRFAGREIRESAKTSRKTIAKLAEVKRRRELEEGFNSITDQRRERVKTIRELADTFLASYSIRHTSDRFARYALGQVARKLGHTMSVDVTEKTVTNYQTVRLEEGAKQKTVNEEVGFLLRILGDRGDVLRLGLRRKKSLRLPVREQIGRAYSQDEKASLLAAAREARSPSIYPALTLALNAGLRDQEIRLLQWLHVDLERAFLVVGKSKTESGEGRTIPLNSELRRALMDYARWYTGRFGTITGELYVFPSGSPLPNDPTKPITSFKTAWTNVRKKAGVKGRWHDSRHTLITELAESGAGDETIRSIAGHVSHRMLHHYSHIRMEAKRRALEAITKSDSRSADLRVTADEVSRQSPEASIVQ